MKISEDDIKFLDNVALEIVKVYTSVRLPQSFDDSLNVSRIAYKQAMAMLEVKHNQLAHMIEQEPKMFKVQKRKMRQKKKEM